MRTPRLLAAAILVTFGCQVTTSTTPPPDTTAEPGSVKPVEQAEPAVKPVEEPKPDPKVEAKKKLDAALAELEAEYKKEAERWTPELVASTEKLTARKWASTDAGMKAALASPHRRPGHASRDQYRHPLETMKFFGIKPTSNVFEVGPGAGWWTELLAVLLAAKGKLAIATTDAASEDPNMQYGARAVKLMLETAPALYGKVETVMNTSSTSFEMGGPDSRDVILLMRMAHNFVRAGKLDAFLAAAHGTLKPKGILAIEQHRAPADADPAESAKKGYVPEAWLIAQVEAAGFKLVAKSEVNANPKDTKDYAQGVWTLPPVLAEGEKDKAKYEAIGESDRMTLKFQKVAKKADPKPTEPKPADPKPTTGAGSKSATGDIKATPDATHDASKTATKPVTTK